MSKKFKNCQKKSKNCQKLSKKSTNCQKIPKKYKNIVRKLSLIWTKKFENYSDNFIFRNSNERFGWQEISMFSILTLKDGSVRVRQCRSVCQKRGIEAPLFDISSSSGSNRITPGSKIRSTFSTLRISKANIRIIIITAKNGQNKLILVLKNKNFAQNSTFLPHKFH